MHVEDVKEKSPCMQDDQGSGSGKRSLRPESTRCVPSPNNEDSKNNPRSITRAITETYVTFPGLAVPRLPPLTLPVERQP